MIDEDIAKSKVPCFFMAHGVLRDLQLMSAVMSWVMPSAAAKCRRLWSEDGNRSTLFHSDSLSRRTHPTNSASVSNVYTPSQVEAVNGGGDYVITLSVCLSVCSTDTHSTNGHISQAPPPYSMPHNPTPPATFQLSAKSLLK